MVEKKEQVIFYDDDGGIHGTLESAIKSSVSSFAERAFDRGGTEDWSVRAANAMAYRYAEFMGFFVSLNSEVSKILGTERPEGMITVSYDDLKAVLDFFKELGPGLHTLPMQDTTEINKLLIILDRIEKEINNVR